MLGGRTFTLFHVRGIRISVDWSWFLFLFFVIIFTSRTYGDLLDESSASTTPFLLGILTAAGFFASIVLHELGHAFVAMRKGIGISGIQLWIFGGMARMDREADSPGTELKVALAGGGIAAAGATGFENAALLDPNAGVSGLLAVVAWLAVINLLLLVFNLLPAFPMDGGRVARALAWWKTGDRTTATRFAANLGRVFAYLFMAGGLALILAGDFFSGIWLGLIGMVVNGSARGAAMQTAISSRIDSILVADVMDREPVAIPGDISIERALDEYFLRYRWPWFPVVDAAHRFLGLLERDRADEVPEVSRASSHVSDLIDPDQGLFIRDDTPLDSLLANQNLRRLGALMAVDADGRLRGVITVEQVTRALQARLAPRAS